MESHTHITAFLLSGGKSTRMGTDKGMLPLNGKKLADHMIGLLDNLFSEINIIANDPAYSEFNRPVYKDLYSDIGPLGGIYTGLTISKTPWNFFIACDMPFMTTDIISLMSDALDNNHDIVVSMNNNRFEPLCAFYNKTCMPVFKKQIEIENFSLQKTIPLLNYKTVEVNNTLIETENPFLNLNTREEFSRYNTQ